MEALWSFAASSQPTSAAESPKRVRPASRTARVGHFVERRVARVVRFLVGVVAGGVVAADHRPARIVGAVLVGAVQQVAVEEQRVAGRHLDMHQFEALERFGHALMVGAGLIAGEGVIDAAEVMRAPDHLQAAILARGRVDRDERAAQEREEDAVLIPVAVVLVPRPGAADARVLHDHFGVVVVDLAFEQFLRRVHDGFAARDHAVDGVARVIPEGEADRAAFAVGATEGVLVEGAVFAGGLAEEADFFGGEHAAGKDVAVAVVVADLRVGERAGGHRAYVSAARCGRLM